ncbi:alpha/beta-hydrolase [Xylaria grammica]|nr:alpha/beta-hydrolase [Xylaria grammica]
MQGSAATDFFHFEYVRVIGMAPMEGADIAECMEVASKIKHNDAESWYQAWTQAAEHAEALAEISAARGDVQSTRWALFRSSNYRRASEFMLHVNPSDPRLLPLIERSQENFRKACALLDSPVHFLEVPYENSKLQAYLYLPTESSRPESGKVPIILNTGGFDSIQEELYFLTAAAARTRGYATLTFDGPGQGMALRRDSLSMRPDWEVVVSTVLDWLYKTTEEHPEWRIDLNRIALIGASMGGYFALRGALDARVKACISSDGFYDFGLAVRQRTPWFWKYLGDSVANTILGLVGKMHFQSRMEFGHAQLTFGSGSVSEALRRLMTYTLEPEGEDPVLPRIKCPVLVTGARDSVYADSLETVRIYDGLTQLRDGEGKELWSPASVGQGSLQAKVAALSHLQAKVFSFLDEVFEVRRPPVDLDTLLRVGG